MNIIIINKTDKEIVFRGHKIRRWHAFGFKPARTSELYYVHCNARVISTFRVNKNGLACHIRSKHHMAANSLIMDMHNRQCRHGIVVKIMQSGYGHDYKIVTSNTIN